MMKTIFIVGKKNSSLANKLKSLGFNVGIFLDKSTPSIKNKEFYSFIYPIDFSSLETMTSDLSQVKTSIDGLISPFDNYVYAKAYIAKFLGLDNCISVEAASRATNKVLMRKAFQEYIPDHNIPFAKVTSLDDIDDFCGKNLPPYIIKPTSLSKSKYIAKCNTVEEAKSFYNKYFPQIKDAYKKLPVHSNPSLIIEKYINGSMHTVAAFADNLGNVYCLPQIVDITMAREVGFDDTFLYSRRIPSNLSSKNIVKLLEVASSASKALGLKNCAIHIELFKTQGGFKIIELGARIGGYREELYQSCCDIDLIKLELSILQGKDIVPYLNTIKNSTNLAVIELFPEKRGKFINIANIKSIKSLDSFDSIKIKVKTDIEIGRSSEGFKAAAILYLKNTDIHQFNNDLNFIKKNIYINVR